jgi:nitrous oxide reductase accessory protein NosL
VSDFFHRRRLDAPKAFYVEGSSVHLCCGEMAPRRDAEGGQYVVAWDRCLPSLVAFETREDAETFRRQNGGTLKTYAELLKEDN